VPPAASAGQLLRSGEHDNCVGVALEIKLTGKTCEAMEGLGKVIIEEDGEAGVINAA
jgi:hypothetical protein